MRTGGKVKIKIGEIFLFLVSMEVQYFVCLFAFFFFFNFDLKVLNSVFVSEFAIFSVTYVMML